MASGEKALTFLNIPALSVSPCLRLKSPFLPRDKRDNKERAQGNAEGQEAKM